MDSPRRNYEEGRFGQRPSRYYLKEDSCSRLACGSRRITCYAIYIVRKSEQCMGS